MKERVDLLILDDWGQPLNANHHRDLMEIVEDRYRRGSLLITSQVPVDHWHEIIGDPTIAERGSRTCVAFSFTRGKAVPDSSLEACPCGILTQRNHRTRYPHRTHTRRNVPSAPQATLLRSAFTQTT